MGLGTDMGSIGAWLTAYFLGYEGQVAHTGYRCYLYQHIGVFGFSSLRIRFRSSKPPPLHYLALIYPSLDNQPSQLEHHTLTLTRISVSVPIYFRWLSISFLHYIHSVYFGGMGIPRLTSHLQPYATLTNLGCNTPECSHHHRKHKEHNIFIDGPGLAYHVYYRALSQSPTVSNAYDAAPSYSEIGQATIAFLHELESYGLLVYAFIERQHFIVDAVAKASAVQEFTSMATSRPTKRESGSAA